MIDNSERSVIVKYAKIILPTIAATATVLIFFYENYRLPLKVLETSVNYKDQTNVIESLSKDIAEANRKLDESTHEHHATNAKLDIAQKRISSQESFLKQLQLTQLFEPNNFYPVTYGRPRIGDQIDSLREIYREELLEWITDPDGDRKVRITDPDSYFEYIEYDYDKETGRISGIVFDAPFTENDILLHRLYEIGGQPTRSSTFNVSRWKVSPDVNSFLIGSNTYMILDKGISPILWRDPIEK